jgi:peptidoglycan/xylan/chitin deacetylase (PgdA/CDA1 family)
VARLRIALPTRTRKRLTRVADAGARRILPSSDVAGRRVVLCYHSVNPSPGYLSLSPELFDRHLTWLEDHCRVVPLDELLAGPRRTGGPYVALTFDDGYADNHAKALPLLAARGMPATFFVTVGFLERNDEVLAHLAKVWRTPGGELSPLSWAEVRDLRGAGMSVGSHTWSHRNLARLSPGDAESDVRRSREVLEDRLGEPVRAVAYPWGKLGRHVTDETFAAARRAGFELGMISLPRGVRDSDGALRVPRMGVGDEPVERLAAKVGGAIDWHAHLHARMPPAVARLLFAEDASA